MICKICGGTGGMMTDPVECYNCDGTGKEPEMNLRGYESAVNRCIEIPTEPYETWNDRFLEALKKEGLKLSTEKEGVYSIMAPWPTGLEPFRWARMSYIVRD